MPFVNDEISGLASQFPPAVKKKPDESFGKLFATAAEVFTAPGEITASVMSPVDSRIDPDFDPYSGENISGYEDFADSFMNVNNANQLANVKAEIDREKRSFSLLSDSGGLGLTAIMAAGALDPINWIPIGAATKAYELGKIGKIAEGAIRTAKAGLLSSVAGESIAQMTQETRTGTQSVQAIAGATILSSILGGAAGAFGRESSPLKAAVSPRLMEEVAESAAVESEIYARELGDSVGAASLRPTTTIEQETLSSAMGLEKLLKFQDPLLNAANSASIETRRIMQDLAEYPLRFKKNEEGIASPIAVESLIKQWQGPLSSSMEALDKDFVKYRLGRDKRFGDVTRIGARDVLSKTEKLSYLDFRKEVGRALRRGDSSQISEVASAARAFRREVLDPLKNEAIEARLLPEGVSVDTAASYLTRVYNKEKIAARRPEFEEIITRWLESSQSSVVRKMAQASKVIAEKLSAAEAKSMDNNRVFSGLSKNDLRDIASEITDTLLGQSNLRSAYETIALTRGPLKERTLNIPDAMIEDFLESDIFKIARKYTRTMSSDVELSKRFGRADLQDQINKVKDNYQSLREKAKKSGAGEKEFTRLNKDLERDIRNIEAVRDRLRNTYGIPDNPDALSSRVFRAARTLNYLRLLGSVVLSSLADPARAVMVHGMSRVLGNGIRPLVSKTKTFKLAANETKLAGTALDMALDTRAMALGEIVDDYGRGSSFERALGAASDHMGMVSLIAPWTAAMKQFAGVISQTRSLQAIEKLTQGNISKKELTRLASYGIDKDSAAAINKMFSKHGVKEDGVWWANTSAWEDRSSARIYRAALAKEVDKTIVTPGQDKPLWVSSELGKIISQFKSYSIAATQRVLLSGLQERDMAQINGLALAVGLGMLSYRLKTDDKYISNDPSVWIKEGVDRAGVTGWFFDANNITEKLTRNKVGISALMGQPQSSRYASRNLASAVLGPSFGLTQDIAEMTGAAATGEWNQSDSHKLRQMIPYQNIFYMRSLFDQAEEGINSSLGVPEKSK